MQTTEQQMIAEHQSDEHNRPGLRDERCPLCVQDACRPTQIALPGGFSRFSATVRVERTERERVQGIASESQRAVRAAFEDAYPAARVRVAVARADALTLTFDVEVVL